MGSDPDDRPLVLFPRPEGSVEDLDVLLEAIDRLRDGPRPFLAAAGPSSGWFERVVAARPAGSVVDLPPVSEAVKAALLAAADVLVQPSRHESFGLVFLEAWTAGTAVIGADIASVREVVGDGGWLFRPGDAGELAACLDRALADPAERAARAACGAARLVGRFTWDAPATPLRTCTAASRAPHAPPDRLAQTVR
jgi:glycosyltransferase involved in cell wall biosynthesis